LCRFEKKKVTAGCLLPTALGLGWAAALAGWLWPLLAGRRCLGWLAVAMAGWPWLAGHSCLGLLAVAMAAMYSYK